MTKSFARFLPVAILLAGTAIFLQARSRGEVFPPRQLLQSFPDQLGGWQGLDQPIDEAALQGVGPGACLWREDDDHLLMRGPVAFEWRGVVPDFAAEP